MAAVLQVVTRRLPWFVKDPAVAVIGEKCYDSLIYDVNLSDSACLSYAVSKALGLAIVLGGSIVKVPQIVKIVNARSSRGLALSSFLLDSAGTGIAVAYNIRHSFPWSTYGESVFLLIQNAVIIALIIIYSTSSTVPTLAIVFTAFAAATYALFDPSIVSPATLKYLLGLSIPLSLSSKVPQILTNFQNGSTGQLSAFLVFNSLAGCLARVYTTSTETGDALLWWGFVGAAALNGVLALQMLASWNEKDHSHARVPVSASVPAVKEKAARSTAAVKESARRVEAAVASASTPVKKTAGTGADSLATPKQATPSASPARTASPASAGKRYVRKLE